jgi:hypothetical protein
VTRSKKHFGRGSRCPDFDVGSANAPVQKYATRRSGTMVSRAREHANTREKFTLDTVGGRYIVLCFFGSAAHPKSRRALDAAFAEPGLFDDAWASFFGVSADPADEAERRITGRIPGYRFFWTSTVTSAGCMARYLKTPRRRRTGWSDGNNGWCWTRHYAS